MLKEGGPRLDAAMKSLDRLQQGDLDELWVSDETSSYLSREQFREDVEWWQKNDGPEMLKREKEAFDELQQSIITPHPAHGCGVIIAPPEIGRRARAAAKGEPGAMKWDPDRGEMTFGDEPLGMRPPAMQQGSSFSAKGGDDDRVPDLDLFRALSYNITEEDNLEVMERLMKIGTDENVPYSAFHDPMPLPEQVPDAWFEDGIHDVFERINRGLPADRCKFRHPWEQAWWEQFQAERILFATGLAWNGTHVIPDTTPRKEPWRDDVDYSYVEEQLGIQNLTAFKASCSEQAVAVASARHEPPEAALLDTYVGMRPNFRGEESLIDDGGGAGGAPGEWDIVIPDDFETVRTPMGP